LVSALIAFGLTVLATPVPVLITMLLIFPRLSGPAMQMSNAIQQFANMLPAYEEVRRLDSELMAQQTIVSRLQHARVTNLLGADVQRVAGAANFLMPFLTSLVLTVFQMAIAFLLAPALTGIALVLIAVGVSASLLMVGRARLARHQGRTFPWRTTRHPPGRHILTMTPPLPRPSRASIFRLLARTGAFPRYGLCFGTASASGVWLLLIRCPPHLTVPRNWSNRLPPPTIKKSEGLHAGFRLRQALTRSNLLKQKAPASPHSPPPNRHRTTNRDFVPWRFSNAGRISEPTALS
jgi:hypothetical protein